MKLRTMTRNLILCGVVVALIVLPVGRARAQNGGAIELQSYSFGMIQGQKARITVVLRRLANPHLPADPVNVRIQLLDVEGEVIAQSDELRVLPGQTKSWDQPRALLPTTGEPGGRIQLRARMLTTHSVDLDGIIPTIEVIDTITGGTVYHAGKTFLIFASGPSPRKN